MRKLLAAPLILLTLVACTPREKALWADWYRADPTAATQFARSLDKGETNSPARRENNTTYTPGNCDQFASLFRANGLPVETFKRIAWRESGCNSRSFVMNSTDSGGGLLGINLKGRLAATWYSWCGATLGNITNASVNVRCAGVAYRKMGLSPWS